MILSRKRKYLLIKKNKNISSFRNSIFFFKNYSIFNFNESIDLSLSFSNNFYKNIKQIKGYLNFPYNYLKFTRVLILVDGYLEYLSRNLGFLNVGIFSLNENFSLNPFDFDVFITSVSFLSYIYLFSNILSVKNIKPLVFDEFSNFEFFLLNIDFYKKFFKSDKYFSLNLSLGKVNFSFKFLEENFLYFLNFLKNLNISNINDKKYISRVSISSTMGVSFVLFN